MEKQNVMEFDYTENDLQDLSEWGDSLEFDDLSDQSEAKEEPLAKRQKTAEISRDGGDGHVQGAGKQNKGSIAKISAAPYVTYACSIRTHIEHWYWLY